MWCYDMINSTESIWICELECSTVLVSCAVIAVCQYCTLILAIRSHIILQQAAAIITSYLILSDLANNVGTLSFISTFLTSLISHCLSGALLGGRIVIWQQGIYWEGLSRWEMFPSVFKWWSWRWWWSRNVCIGSTQHRNKIKPEMFLRFRAVSERDEGIFAQWSTSTYLYT